MHGGRDVLNVLCTGDRKTVDVGANDLMSVGQTPNGVNRIRLQLVRVPSLGLSYYTKEYLYQYPFC